MAKLFSVSTTTTIIFIIGVAVIQLVFKDSIAFVYGAAIALLNSTLSQTFLRWNQRKVSSYPSQALVAVLNSMIIRFFAMGLLLAIGLLKLKIDTESMIIGFVLGQIFYIAIHLIRIIEHGK